MASLLTTQIGTTAHTPALQIPTYAFINVAPNPAGLGQTVTIGFWLQQPAPTSAANYGDRWTGMTITVTKPDGQKETLGPFTADSTGGSFTTYTPNALGNYTFQMSFPGQTLANVNPPPGGYPPAISSYIGDYYQPSTSNTATLIVQQEIIPSIPQVPLPSTYWERPIQSVNSQWYAISGNWLGLNGAGISANTGQYNATGNYNPYTTAPTSAHILWSKPEAFGGLIGGEFGGSDTSNYYSTRQYERMFAPIIINGVLYYTMYPGSTQNPTGWIAVNLKTGQTLWTNDATNYGGGSPAQSALTSSGIVTVLRCGQTLNFISPNQFGGLAYLWSTGTPAGIIAQPGTTTFNMFDAMTGKYILSVVNGSYTSIIEDESGSLIAYYVNSTIPNAPTLNMWNSTKAIMDYGLAAGQLVGSQNNIWTWRPRQGAIIPAQYGIQWSMPLATNISGVPLPSTLALAAQPWASWPGPGINSNVLVLTALASSGPTTYSSTFIIEAGYSATTGQQLWIVNRTVTPYTAIDYMPTSHGIWVEVDQATGTCNGYSVTTGERVWGPITLPNPNPYNSIGRYYGQVANGMLYISGFGGDIWAMDIQTGTINWQTSTNKLVGDAGSDTPYGVWPLWQFGNPGAIADGMLFLAIGHEYSPPLFRGAQALAINLTNGELVWSVMGFYVDGSFAIADGVMVGINAYDNQIYSYGVGPSKTTVNTPSVGVTTLTPITISGTVTDISAGAQQSVVAANYPNGLPCVSGDSMSEFMQAVYMQQATPNNVTGVPVTLSVVDANGNYRTIGTTTSDAMGTFAYNWTPDISGAYTVYASFTGSESYYPSNAVAHFFASEPVATPSSTTTQQTPSMADLYLVPGIIGIIIAIVVVGAVIILALRKRP